MTKLKTLKDIEERLRCPQKGDPFRMSLGEALRQEVIKWIKEEEFITTQDWKDFFNITEEDLE